MTLQPASTRSSTGERRWTSYESDLGTGWVGWDESGAVDRISLPGLSEPPGPPAVPPPQVGSAIVDVVDALAGRSPRRAGAGYVTPAARTSWDAAIYAAVSTIPPGETSTYSEVAEHVGRPGRPGPWARRWPGIGLLRSSRAIASWVPTARFGDMPAGPP